MNAPSTHRPVRRWVVRDGLAEPGTRDAAEEVPVAFVYDGGTLAVLMSTPADLEDLALGFSLTEGVVDTVEAVTSVEIVPHRDGLEARLWLADGLARALGERRRALAGPTGCGLCGVESLAEASRVPLRVTSDLTVTAAEIEDAAAAMRRHGGVGAITRATHAAGLWTRPCGLDPVREDVGRHNALDKLVGALARAGRSGRDGMVLLTSRVSIEMVQKTARLGAPIMVAFSAPTALAVRTAEAAGITLVGVAREDGFEVFTGAGRIDFAARQPGTLRDRTALRGDVDLRSGPGGRREVVGLGSSA